MKANYASLEIVNTTQTILGFCYLFKNYIDYNFLRTLYSIPNVIIAAQRSEWKNKVVGCYFNAIIWTLSGHSSSSDPFQLMTATKIMCMDKFCEGRACNCERARYFTHLCRLLYHLLCRLCKHLLLCNIICATD